jgi:hypothetical protein
MKDLGLDSLDHVEVSVYDHENAHANPHGVLVG